MNNTQTAERLERLLGLKGHAVAIAFVEEPPAGVPRVEKSGPASCSYWTQATEGASFYTEAADHLKCPIGAHTHAVAMPPETAAELQAMAGQMISLQYLRAEEIPSIPVRRTPFQKAVYAPLAKIGSAPDVVIVRGNARQIMLLTEAAQSAGIAAQSAGIMTRPTCAFIPEAINTGRAVSSFGCIGNRVYTGLADAELYFATPGAKLGELLAALETIVAANTVLEQFHLARRASA